MKLLKILFFIFLCALLLIIPTIKFNSQRVRIFGKNPQHQLPILRENRIVTKENYEIYWYKSTFPTRKASITYHTKKHGRGRTPYKYTKDAIDFYEDNKHLRQPILLKDGKPGYKIKKGERGGTWTRNGKIVTFWG